MNRGRSAAPLCLCVVMIVLGIVGSFLTVVANREVTFPENYTFIMIRSTLLGSILPLALSLIALLGGMTRSNVILLFVKLVAVVMLLIQLISNVGLAFWPEKYNEIVNMNSFIRIAANVPGVGILNLFLLIVRNFMQILKAGMLMWAHLLLSMIRNLLGLAFSFSLLAVE